MCSDPTKWDLILQTTKWEMVIFLKQAWNPHFSTYFYFWNNTKVRNLNSIKSEYFKLSLGKLHLLQNFSATNALISWRCYTYYMILVLFWCLWVTLAGRTVSQQIPIQALWPLCWVSSNQPYTGLHKSQTLQKCFRLEVMKDEDKPLHEMPS